MLLWLPLLVAIFGTANFVFNTDEDWKWKLLAAAMLVASLVTAFVVQVHFLLPLFLNAALAIWMVIYWKVNQ